jgi:hypothetical protein
MQTVNNLILNTTAAAADGQWRNVSNFVASSIQVIARDASGLPTALTGDIWVEVSNDPSVNIDNLATQIAAPAIPVLGQFSPSREGYQQPSPTKAATYGVKLTYVNDEGETEASAAASLSVTAGNVLVVAAPGPDATLTSPPTGPFATGYNVYIQNGSGAYILQNPLYNSGRSFGNESINGPIPVDHGFILYAWQNTGVAAPAVNTTGTPNVGANITGNLNATAVLGADVEAAVAYDTSDGLYSASATQVMWAPSCLFFNWVRVRVNGQTAGHSLQAYLFGQNG